MCPTPAYPDGRFKGCFILSSSLRLPYSLSPTGLVYRYGAGRGYAMARGRGAVPTITAMALKNRNQMNYFLFNHYFQFHACYSPTTYNYSYPVPGFIFSSRFQGPQGKVFILAENHDFLFAIKVKNPKLKLSLCVG